MHDMMMQAKDAIWGVWTGAAVIAFAMMKLSPFIAFLKS
jgi:hypothetical protein